ncbi:DNA translocase FtsK [Acidobacterium capsulatum]|uniref:FtsK/SpoIIIE family protein n=2 Tax=Acidobacterium TaxID=33973 RepID=C1F663_ACIC5|nr:MULTISPECIES: DNA translocase FtsK [Acidobacterium]ACO32648.1 FtsK/SpoIIIE family protein [Acidobacterium capsulatum ATCC 51196]HCT60860.1 DNA translocase FtsK [Acidobacterium sp.]
MKPIRIVITPTRNRRLNELIGFLILVTATLLLLALVSYHPTDPSFDTVRGAVHGAEKAAPIHNWIGVTGAYLSDLLLQLEGLASFLLPLLLGGLGFAWLRSRPIASPKSKLLGAALALLFVPAIFGLFPHPVPGLRGLPASGLTGRIVADALVRLLNATGAWIVTLALTAASIYLCTTFSLNTAREWLAVRLAFVLAWRDRMKNWREARARPKQEKIAAKLAKKQERALARQRKAGAKSSGQELSPEEDSSAVENLPVYTRQARFSEFEEAASAQQQQAVAPARPFAMPDLPAEPAWESEAEPEPVPELRVEPRPRAVRREPMEEVPVEPVWQQEPEPEPIPVPAAHIAVGERADASLRTVTVAPKSVSGYRLPPSTLLHKSNDTQVVREEELRAEAQVLVEKCAEFDVRGQVVRINPGPVVTTFEFRPEPGVKYSRVTGLADDLCLAMRAESILIERMAGKSTVGIQVPNETRETIWLREIIEAENFANAKSKLTLALGKDINGQLVTSDLATMPHVLIAGSTGSGKSVAINAMIMSVLFKATPDQVRLILVDPKRVELGMYEGIPHLFTPIITEPKMAANALRNAVREMERRLKLLASRSVRNLDQYNKLFDNPSLFEDDPEQKPLPYIMIIIDELADLMMLDKANVEEAITRLAQMARAVGIHLVLATQRPSVDVITGLIKANVPSRLSFRLATKVDSRTILDSNGAESLLGRGDSLFLPPGTSRLQRVHAPFVTEKEISAVTEFWKKQGEAEYVQGFLDAPKDDRGRELDGDGGGDDDNDELFEDAVRLVLEFGKASTSLLQRRLRIGYGRAAHLIDMMERDGIVGPADGSRPREILKSPDWLNEVDQAIR